MLSTCHYDQRPSRRRFVTSQHVTGASVKIEAEYPSAVRTPRESQQSMTKLPFCRLRSVSRRVNTKRVSNYPAI